MLRSYAMGEGKTQLIQDQWLLYGNNGFKNHQDGGDDDDHQWKQEEDYHETSSSTSSSFIGENSSSSSSTICSLDTTDDASSSSSPPSFNGSLYDLSSLMSQLPIKRGLSKSYNGKSESFTSLSRVTSIEELAKKETPFKRKMKTCKSYGAGLDAYKSYTSPKPIITKKASTKISFSSSSQSRRGSFTSRSTRPPLIPVQENHLGC